MRVFFYGRPKTARNAFGLGLAALGRLKENFGGRVEVICAGENWNPAQFGLAGKVRNLGVLGSLDEVAELYRSCDIGLVFMFSKHPSYQPFEFMASGMATVSNINPATAWLLRDGENCLLTPPLPTPTAERLGRLVEDSPAAGEDRRRRPGGGAPLPVGGSDRARVAGDHARRPGLRARRRVGGRRSERLGGSGHSSSAIRGASRRNFKKPSATIAIRMASGISAQP